MPAKMSDVSMGRQFIAHGLPVMAESIYAQYWLICLLILSGTQQNKNTERSPMPAACTNV